MEFSHTTGAGELANNPVEALEILFHWLDRNANLLAERARNARSLGHPRAAYEAADLIWDAALSGSTRKVHPSRKIRQAR